MFWRGASTFMSATFGTFRVVPCCSPAARARAAPPLGAFCTPAERAEMLKRLGLKRVAYDWRERHVKEFEEEILQYKKHGLEFFAFWSAHEEAFSLFAKHRIHP